MFMNMILPHLSDFNKCDVPAKDIDTNVPQDTRILEVVCLTGNE